MVGYPLLPTISYSFADPSSSKWRWLRRRQQQQQQQQQQLTAADGWEDTGCSSMLYTPTQADLGCVLRVECTPAAHQHHQKDHTATPPPPPPPPAAAAAAAAAEPAGLMLGEAVSAEAGPVLSGPQQSAARLRALSPGVPLPEPWRFRVMSYNILADQYAGTSYAQQVRHRNCSCVLTQKVQVLFH
jgi:2',5'-phosphodiesterase